MLVARRGVTSALLRGAGLRCFSTLEDNLKEWEAQASKECKGGDPYKTFSSTNNDVSPVKEGQS